MGHILTTSQECRRLENFATMTSIISGFAKAPAARLRITWDQVPRRTQALLETMRVLMASTKNFGNYREALHAADPPCIPFLGKSDFNYDILPDESLLTGTQECT